jgi:hypothetical protein
VVAPSPRHEDSLAEWGTTCAFRDFDLCCQFGLGSIS